MAETNVSRGGTPPSNLQQDYDVTRMREEDFERLAVYIVPDVPCERGSSSRAEKTLPRSLTLKPSLVLSTPSAPVITLKDYIPLNTINLQFILFSID